MTTLSGGSSSGLLATISLTLSSWRSRSSVGYGRLVELWATDRYPLTLDYPVVDGLKFNATDEDGRPWDVKGSMVNGVRPTFKFWEDQHETLADADGGYALVWYRAEGREITVVSSRTVRRGI